MAVRSLPVIVTGSVIFLPCSCIEKTYAFYHGLLHLPVAQKQSENLYIFDTGYGYWGFCEYADGREPLSGNRGVCLSLNMESDEEVDRMYAVLKDRCEIHQAPQRHSAFPVYSFFAKDPDGYLVEFQKIDDEGQKLDGHPMELHL